MTTDKIDKTAAKELETNMKVWDKKYSLGDAHVMIDAHRALTAHPNIIFTGRHCAWSADGRLCVVVGSENIIAVFQK